jgi:hypothetical protein
MKTILAKLMGLSRSLLEFYLPIFRELMISGMDSLLPLALEIVASLAEEKGTGAKKREEAVLQLQDVARNLGIRASESLVRLTIESAVSRLKTEAV